MKMLKLKKAFAEKDCDEIADILSSQLSKKIISDPMIASQLFRYIRTLKIDTVLLEKAQLSESVSRNLQSDIIALAQAAQ